MSLKQFICIIMSFKIKRHNITRVISWCGWRRGAVHLSSFPWLGVLARRVFAIPATSTAHERLFSTAGNVMAKKRSRLTCDNMEELVYLHEVWRQVRNWEAVKKMHLEWFLLESMKHIAFNVFFCLLFVDSFWMIVTLTLARCFSSLFLSLYTYTYTYTYCYYYCILNFLVLTKPALAWVPVKASFSTSNTIFTLYRHRSTNRFCVSLTFESRVFIDNWKWVSKGCRSYLIHPGKPLAFPLLS